MTLWEFNLKVRELNLAPDAMSDKPVIAMLRNPDGSTIELSLDTTDQDQTVGTFFYLSPKNILTQGKNVSELNKSNNLTK